MKKSHEMNKSCSENEPGDGLNHHPTITGQSKGDLIDIIPSYLPTSEDSSEIAEASMRRSVLDDVFGKTGIDAVVSPLNGTLVCGALWTSVAHARLFIWLGTLIAAMFVRYATASVFRSGVREANIRAWDWVFGASLVLPSTMWGAGALFILPASSAFHEAIVYVFLIGMAGGTALSYSALKPAAIVSLVVFLGPVTARFLMTSGTGFVSMALGGIVVMIVSIASIVGLGSFIRRSFQSAHRLDVARRTAEHLARVDTLTGIPNRRAFYEMGGYLITQARRINYPLSLLLIDVDHFKRINDTCGHAKGDAVLRSLAAKMKQSCRGTDVLGRLGGDEFGILLPGNTLNEAVAFASRFRQTLLETDEYPGGINGRVTCSIGVAVLSREMDLDRLVQAADMTLYDSKQKGRDRISH